MARCYVPPVARGKTRSVANRRPGKAQHPGVGHIPKGPHRTQSRVEKTRHTPTGLTDPCTKM